MVTVEFEWDEENRDLMPIYGVAVVMALDEDGKKQLGMAHLGEPDAFTCYGLLHGAAVDARNEVEMLFDLMNYSEDEHEE